MFHAAGVFELGPSDDVNTGPVPNTDAYQGGTLIGTGTSIYGVSASGPNMTFSVEVCPTGVCGDWDGDGIDDLTDNCPSVWNPDQDDSSDGDGVGDACDTCLGAFNPAVDPNEVLPWMTRVSGQRDDDADGVGNRCDFGYDQSGTLVSPGDFAQAVASQGFSPVASFSCGSAGDLLCGLFDHDGVGSVVSPSDFAADVLKADPSTSQVNGPSCGAACTPPLGGAIGSGSEVLGKAICVGPAC